jgi:hypothetical protein
VISLSREDLVDLALHIEDPEELCADLIEAMEMATHDGDLSEIEVLLEAVESFFDAAKSESLGSWRTYWSNEFEVD